MLTTLAQQQVRFEVGQAFLYTNDELPMLFPGDVNGATLSAIGSERWAWLLELGEHSAQFLGLERIEIEESMKGWRTVSYHGFWWDLPYQLRRGKENTIPCLADEAGTASGLVPGWG